MSTGTCYVCDRAYDDHSNTEIKWCALKMIGRA